MYDLRSEIESRRIHSENQKIKNRPRIRHILPSASYVQGLRFKVKGFEWDIPSYLFACVLWPLADG